MKKSINTLALSVTYQCNIACKHCGLSCSPKEKDWMTISEMKDLTVQASELGISVVVLTGGEPTLIKDDDLIDYFKFVKTQTNIPIIRMVTNAKWANTYENAHDKLRKWKEAGLDELNCSCGEYHQEFVPIENIKNAYLAAINLKYITVLLAGEFIVSKNAKLSPESFEKIIGNKLLSSGNLSLFSDYSHGMGCSTVIDCGRGKDYINKEDIAYSKDNNIGNFCADITTVISCHPDGKTTACCGVMVREDCLLDTGYWRAERLNEIVERTEQDTIINWIHHLGLQNMKNWILNIDKDIIFPIEYSSLCDLCNFIIKNDKCVKILLEYGHKKNEEITANKIVNQATVYSNNFKY